MYKPLTIVMFFIFVFVQQGFSQSKGDQVFNDDVLHVLKVYSETEPNLYELMQSEIDLFDRPYHLVKMVLDGVEMDSVGVRVKGGSSTFDRVQFPIKIDINEYVSGQTFDGLKKINLSNSYSDEFRQKDDISYELFRRAGVAAPRSAYVEVYLNDVFVNIYILVEQIDKVFIKQNFSDEGSLTKHLEHIYGTDLFEEFIIVSSEEKIASVKIRNYFKFLMINTIVDAVDNYPNNNFYVYRSDKDNVVHVVPWDYNSSLGFQFIDDGEYSIFPFADAETIWGTPELKSILLEVACEMKDYLLDEYFVDKLIQDNYTTILSNSQGVTVANPAPLKAFLMDKQQWLIDRLIAEGISCELTYPLEIGDLVINEFVAKSDSLGGVQEPDGGTPDWIELYNNTDEPIVLDHHFYLSDDVDFPKKWNFESPITIPANGYQIIWADRDVQQQGVHTNFKIEKSKGDLMLVYEDLTIIDEVSYTEQELNKGYARIPNGTGDFTIQDYTFNTNNGTSSAESTIDALKNISVYPNPTTQSININCSELIESTKVFSANGNLLMQSKSGNHSIDIEHITSGIYFIQIQTANQNGMIRFVKQ